MTGTRTLAIIKLSAVGRNMAPAILADIERAGFVVVQTVTDARPAQFAELYLEHIGKPFYDGLIASVAYGSLVLLLSRENAVAVWRDLMGPTDPVKARETAPDSLRARYGLVLPDNAVHGSDSDRAAHREIAIFFG